MDMVKTYMNKWLIAKVREGGREGGRSDGHSEEMNSVTVNKCPIMKWK